MLFTFCLMFGILAAGPDAAPAGVPVVSAVRMLHPAIVKESIVSQITLLLTLINYSRAEAGLQPLQLDDRLTRAATNHASVMARNGRLSHQFPGESDLTGRLAPALRLDRAGENVVYDVTVQGAHEAFMESPLHRINVLNSAFDSVGIGLIATGGLIYVVEDFAHRVPNLKDDDVAQRVAELFINLRQTDGVADLLPYVDNVRLQQMACAMAQRETLDGKPPFSLPGVRFAASYATVDPNQIPANVARLAALNGIGHFSVGACYARTPKYPTGLYWVTIALFDGRVPTTFASE
jgi:hypothetical protein